MTRTTVFIASLFFLLCGLLLGGAIGLTAGNKQQMTAEERLALQTVQDELAIRGLLNAYATHLDGRQFRDWVALFTADGRWDGGLGEFEGQDALLDMLHSNLGTAPLEGERYRSLHLFSNPVIEIDGNTATASSRYAFYAAGEDGAPRPLLVGHYEDRLLKTDHGWRFAERRVHDDLFAGP